MSNNEQQAASETGEIVQPQNRNRAEKPMAGADFITSIGFLILGTAIFITAWNMKVWRVYLSSPGIFPMIIGAIFILFGLFLLYRSYMRGGLIGARRIISFDSIVSGVTSPISKKLCIVFLLIFGYVALLGRIPFLYLSMGYILLTLWYLRAAKWYLMIIISVIFPIAINALFTNFFRIPMP